MKVSFGDSGLNCLGIFITCFTVASAVSFDPARVLGFKSKVLSGLRGFGLCGDVFLILLSSLIFPRFGPSSFWACASDRYWHLS